MSAAGGNDLAAVRRATAAARRVLPDAVGELLSRELAAHLRFGHRFDTSGLAERVAQQILAMAEEGRATAAVHPSAGSSTAATCSPSSRGVSAPDGSYHL